MVGTVETQITNELFSLVKYEKYCHKFKFEEDFTTNGK